MSVNECERILEDLIIQYTNKEKQIQNRVAADRRYVNESLQKYSQTIPNDFLYDNEIFGCLLILLVYKNSLDKEFIKTENDIKPKPRFSDPKPGFSDDIPPNFDSIYNYAEKKFKNIGTTKEEICDQANKYIILYKLFKIRTAVKYSLTSHNVNFPKNINKMSIEQLQKILKSIGQRKNVFNQIRGRNRIGNGNEWYNNYSYNLV
jgi:hypothetical protein